MPVTRCVCFRTSFRVLQDQARTQGWSSLGEIAAGTGCGSGCGGCRPYLAAMLATGATTFAVRTGDGPPVPCAPEPWDIV